MKFLMNGKKLAIIGIFLVLLLGGAAFGLYVMKMNAASFMGMGVDVSEQPEEVRLAWEDRFQKAVVREDVLNWTIKQSDYAARMDVPQEAAFEDLKSRVKVEYKKHKSMIEVGLTGKRKQNDQMAEVARFLNQAATSIVAQEEPAFEAALRSKAGQ